MEEEFVLPPGDENNVPQKGKVELYTENGEITTDSEAGNDTSDESEEESSRAVHSSSSDYQSSSESDDEPGKGKKVKDWFKDKYKKTRDFFRLYEDECEMPPKKKDACKVKSKIGTKTLGNVFDTSAKHLLESAIGTLMSMRDESVILTNAYGKREFNVKDLQAEIKQQMKNENFMEIGTLALKAFPVEAIVGFTKRFGFAKITDDKKMEEEFMNYYDNSFDTAPIENRDGKKKKKNGDKIGVNGRRKKVPARVRRRRKPGIVIGPRRAVSPYYRKRFPRRKFPQRRRRYRKIPRTKYYNPRYRNFWMYRAKRNPLLRRRIGTHYSSFYYWLLVLSMLLSQKRYYDYQRALQGYYVDPYRPGYGIYKKIGKDVKPIKKTKAIQSKVERKREREKKRKRLLKMMKEAKKNY